MSIPKKIKLGGHTINVIQQKGGNIPSHCGMTSANSNTIIVNIDNPMSIQEETLLHEIIHLIFFNMGHGFKGHQDIDGDEEREPHTEHTVEGLAQGLYQVLSDNDLKWG